MLIDLIEKEAERNLKKRDFLRAVYCVALMFICFGPAIISSMHIVSHHTHVASMSRPSTFGFVFQITSDAIGLGLMALFLRLQRRDARSIGFDRLKLTDFAAAIAVWAAAEFASFVIIVAYVLATHAFRHHHADVAPMNVGFAHVVGHSARIMTLAGGLVVINGFYEDLIVRAYLMTDILFFIWRFQPKREARTSFLREGAFVASSGDSVERRNQNRAARLQWLAVVVSTLLQTSYHFYQGVAPAVSYIGGFAVMSIYFLRTRRIWPVIIAHILIDSISFFTP